MVIHSGAAAAEASQCSAGAAGLGCALNVPAQASPRCAAHLTLSGSRDLLAGAKTLRILAVVGCAAAAARRRCRRAGQPPACAARRCKAYRPCSNGAGQRGGAQRAARVHGEAPGAAPQRGRACRRTSCISKELQAHWGGCPCKSSLCLTRLVQLSMCSKGAALCGLPLLPPQPAVFERTQTGAGPSGWCRLVPSASAASRCLWLPSCCSSSASLQARQHGVGGGRPAGAPPPAAGAGGITTSGSQPGPRRRPAAPPDSVPTASQQQLGVWASAARPLAALPRLAAHPAVQLGQGWRLALPLSLSAKPLSLPRALTTAPWRPTAF